MRSLRDWRDATNGAESEIRMLLSALSEMRGYAEEVRRVLAQDFGE